MIRSSLALQYLTGCHDGNRETLWRLCHKAGFTPEHRWLRWHDTAGGAGGGWICHRCHRERPPATRHAAPGRPSAAAPVLSHRHGLRWRKPATGKRGLRLLGAPGATLPLCAPNWSAGRGATGYSLAIGRPAGGRRRAGPRPDGHHPRRPAPDGARGRSWPDRAPARCGLPHHRGGAPRLPDHGAGARPRLADRAGAARR